jgi:hypothetical protein
MRDDPRGPLIIPRQSKKETYVTFISVEQTSAERSALIDSGAVHTIIGQSTLDFTDGYFGSMVQTDLLKGLSGNGYSRPFQKERGDDTYYCSTIQHTKTPSSLKAGSFRVPSSSGQALGDRSLSIYSRSVVGWWPITLAK